MPNFLGHTLPLYDQHLAAWHRDERRLVGGDAVLEELRQWKGETVEDLAVRKDTAGYIPLPMLHASTLTGHLSSQTPMPEFAELGEARERTQLKGARSKAEMLWYNVDGIGQDGSEMMPWFDGVQKRALATGFRWVLVEKPSLAVLQGLREIRPGRVDGKLTGEEESLFRPYAVEYSPTQVPFWQYTSGRLDFAVIRIPLVPTNLVDDSGSVMPSDLGYYLLVRRGFTGLGEAYAPGGWWKFDSNQEAIRDADGQPEAGTWEQTLGQIPLFQFVGESSTGTSERPAIARSLTMELGQIAVGLMLLRSARDYNIIQAAKSVNHVLGIDPTKHGEVIAQQNLGSITIGYPPVMGPDGGVIVPQIWNSSAALLDSQAFESVIHSSLEEAREIMVRQVTSTPDSSGRSKEAGFAEATSPLLAGLAGRRQQALNTFLYFASLRFGIPNPTASVTIPREFDLAPLVDEIDKQAATMRLMGIHSATLESHMVFQAAQERNCIPEGEEDTVKAELEESARLKEERASQMADILGGLGDGQEGNRLPPENRLSPPVSAQSDTSGNGATP